MTGPNSATKALHSDLIEDGMTELQTYSSHFSTSGSVEFSLMNLVKTLMTNSHKTHVVLAAETRVSWTLTSSSWYSVFVCSSTLAHIPISEHSCDGFYATEIKLLLILMKKK